MAYIYGSGLVLRTISGRIAGIKIAKGQRPTPDFSRYTRPGGARPSTLTSYRAVTRGEKSNIRRSYWEAQGTQRAGSHMLSPRDRRFLDSLNKFLYTPVTVDGPGPGKQSAKATRHPGDFGPKGATEQPAGRQPSASETKKESYPPETDPNVPWWSSPPTHKAECHAQRIADITYQGFPDAIRDQWRRACTKNYRTPYDVYQHVAIPRLIRGIPVSPTPPPQAGWKLRELEQSLGFWHSQEPRPHWSMPDPSGQTWGLGMVHARFAEYHYWNGFRWIVMGSTLWSLYADVGLGNHRDKGFITITVYAGYNGDGDSWTSNPLWWPEIESNPLPHDIMAHSASVVWHPVKRDSLGNMIEPRTPDTDKAITVKVVTPTWAWYHYHLPYPSKKADVNNMAPYIKSWPAPTPTVYYVPYK